MRHSSLLLLLGSLVLAPGGLAAQEAQPAELPVTGLARSGDSSVVARAGAAKVPPAKADPLADVSGGDARRGGEALDSTDEEPPIPLRFDWRLLVGGAMPLGEFGEQSGVRPGFARVGFSLGADYVLGTENFGWINSLLLSLNPSDIPSTHKAVYSTLDLPPNTTVDVGPWYTLWVSTGFQYAIAPADATRLFAIGQVGVLVSRSSDVRFNVEGVDFRQAPVWAGSLAFSLGLGAEVAEHVVISGRYMLSTPTYDLYITGPEGLSIHNLYDQPISLLQLLVGISF